MDLYLNVCVMWVFSEQINRKRTVQFLSKTSRRERICVEASSIGFQEFVHSKAPSNTLGAFDCLPVCGRGNVCVNKAENIRKVVILGTVCCNHVRAS